MADMSHATLKGKVHHNSVAQHCMMTALNLRSNINCNSVEMSSSEFMLAANLPTLLEITIH